MRWPLLCVALLCGGCESLTYYAQSIRGQAEVVAATRPIPEVLGDPTTADGVRERLAEIPQVRAFAVAELGLVDSGSFEGYADLQREAMVWSLTAAPATSLVPREWCYPVIGCARYRGYFRRDAAERAAERLAIAGWDVAVEPAPAYSTLGWFDDPLPSTVIDWPLPTIVALLFHELAHETLYLRGDSTFNESYATLVEREGLRRWLASYGSPEQRREMARLAGLRQDFAALLDETRVELSALYAAPITRGGVLRPAAQVSRTA